MIIDKVIESKVIAKMLEEHEDLSDLNFTDDELREYSKMYELSDDFLRSIPDGKISIFKRSKFTEPLKKELKKIENDLTYFKNRLIELRKDKERHEIFIEGTINDDKKNTYEIQLEIINEKILELIKVTKVTIVKQNILLSTFIGIHSKKR